MTFTHAAVTLTLVALEVVKKSLLDVAVNIWGLSYTRYSMHWAGGMNRADLTETVMYESTTRTLEAVSHTSFMCTLQLKSIGTTFDLKY